jgi:hypothetical protein
MAHTINVTGLTNAGQNNERLKKALRETIGQHIHGLQNFAGGKHMQVFVQVWRSPMDPIYTTLNLMHLQLVWEVTNFSGQTVWITFEFSATLEAKARTATELLIPNGVTQTVVQKGLKAVTRLNWTSQTVFGCISPGGGKFPASCVDALLLKVTTWWVDPSAGVRKYPIVSMSTTIENLEPVLNSAMMMVNTDMALQHLPEGVQYGVHVDPKLFRVNCEDMICVLISLLRFLIKSKVKCRYFPMDIQNLLNDVKSGNSTAEQPVTKTNKRLGELVGHLDALRDLSSL